MHIDRIGHVMLKVRDVEASARWYCDVLGCREVGEMPARAMVFLSWGDNHHDLAFMAAEDGGASGLHHVAFRVAGGDDELRAFVRHLERHGVAMGSAVDHTVSHSVYFEDPDGNLLECYIDTPPESWAGIDGALTRFSPLRL